MSIKIKQLEATVANLASKLTGIIYFCSTELTKTNSIGRIPASCSDLQSIGYVKSGIYSILVENQVQNVNCDFTQPSDGAGS